MMTATFINGYWTPVPNNPLSGALALLSIFVTHFGGLEICLFLFKFVHKPLLILALSGLQNSL